MTAASCYIEPMDGLALGVGVLIGGGLVGALAFVMMRGSRELHDKLRTDLDAARSELLGVNNERIRLDERVKTVDSLSEEVVRLRAEIVDFQAQIGEANVREAELEADIRRLNGEHAAEIAKQNELIATREAGLQALFDEKTKLLAEAETRFRETFDALSKQALAKNAEEFTAYAEQILKRHNEQAKGELEKRETAISERLKPLEESLKDYKESVVKIEQTREKDSTRLEQQIKQLADLQQRQQSTATELRNLLRGPQSRGRLGELMLKSILDRAGLQEGLHYDLQVSESTEEGRARPDCVVYLPSGKALVIDAKTPLDAYEQSIALEDGDLRDAKLKEHARVVKAEVDRLAKRPYQDLKRDVEMTLMYLPIEASLSAALKEDPEIHTHGWNKRIVIAAPTMLFGLLQIVLLDWRQQDVLTNAREIERLGTEMLDRIAIVAESFRKVGSALASATNSYNSAAGSLEGNLIVTAHRFQKLGVHGKKKVEATPIVTATPRAFTKPEALSLPTPDRVRELEQSALGFDPEFEEATSPESE